MSRVGLFGTTARQLRADGRSVRHGGLAVLVLALLGASPAAANPLTDCFQRIAVVFHPHRHPAHPIAHRAIHRVRHVRPRPHPRPHRIAASGPSRAYAHRTRYILKPIACETHPTAALMSPVPGAEVPETPQILLAELAGPPATPAEAAEAAPAPEVPAALAAAPPEFFPNIFGGPGGVPLPGGFPGVIGPGVPSGPGGPPVTPPVGPVEVTPPPVTPPVAPPIVPPVDTTVTPPVAPPVIGPSPGPPVVETPPTPNVPGVPVVPGVPPVGAVPEPATWALMLLGFFGLGGALRRRRRPLRA
jgi:hypothetical protein